MLRDRVAGALRLGATCARPLFIPTGGQGRYGRPEAVLMAALLADGGVPPEQILIEDSATDTLSSVRAVRRMLGRLDASAHVYLATSDFHLPRCLTLFRLAGLPARPCPAIRAQAAGSSWRRWYWRLREIPALPYDALLAIWLRLCGRL
jgi:uncharacterized SAM-binding protein YcdF (DUF218 family)